MRDPAERDNHANLWQGRQLRLEKRSTIRNFGGRRLVLRRQAFDAVDDNRAVERQPVVDPRIVAAFAEAELRQRRE